MRRQSLRETFLEVAPNLGDSSAFKILQQLKYKVICNRLRSGDSTVEPHPDGHILENLWKLSIAEFTAYFQPKQQRCGVVSLLLEVPLR